MFQLLPIKKKFKYFGNNLNVSNTLMWFEMEFRYTAYILQILKDFVKKVSSNFFIQTIKLDKPFFKSSKG